MCSRFELTATPDEVREVFGYDDRPNFPPREVIRPTEPIGIVLRADGRRRFRLVRWGFWPAWVKDPATFTVLINARAETALEKPSFRSAMRHGRCLIPASGFVEWRRDGKTRTPFRIAPRGGGLVAFAGLTETWSAADGSEVDTAAILTVDADAVVGAIHDRMPAVIPPDKFEEWLDPATDAKAARRLLATAPDDLFEALPVVPSPRPPRPRGAAPARPRTRGDGSTGGGDQMDLF